MNAFDVVLLISDVNSRVVSWIYMGIILFLHYTFRMPMGGDRIEGFVNRCMGWFVVACIELIRLLVLDLGVE